MAARGNVTSMREKEFLGVYTCPICRDYFAEPRMLSCKHVFCQDCLEGVLQASQSNTQFFCPTCRTPLPVNEALTNPAVEVVMDMTQRQIVCQTCRSLKRLSDFRDHRDRCESGAGSSAPAKTSCPKSRRLPVAPPKPRNGSNYPRSASSAEEPAIGATGGSNVLEPFPEMPSFIPIADVQSSGLTSQNTFSCSYCGQSNMTQKELVRHCWSQHKLDRNQQRVCPICAAMPWGNSEQKSKYLIGHLVVRHRRDYGLIHQNNQEEEIAFRVAVQRSIHDYYQSFRNGE